MNQLGKYILLVMMALFSSCQSKKSPIVKINEYTEKNKLNVYIINEDKEKIILALAHDEIKSDSRIGLALVSNEDRILEVEAGKTVLINANIKFILQTNLNGKLYDLKTNSEVSILKLIPKGKYVWSKSKN